MKYKEGFNTSAKFSLNSLTFPLLCVFGLLVYYSDETYNLGLICSFFFFILLCFKIKKKYGYSSLAFMFFIFFGLYSYSVPLSILFNIDLSPHIDQYVHNWSSIDSSLMSFSLSVHLALIGCWLAFIFSFNRNKQSEKSLSISFLVKTKYFNISIILGLLSTLFLVINTFRIGGFEVLLEGKKAYQSAISDTSLMLPDERFFYLSVIFFSLDFIKHSVTLSKFTRFFAVNILYISTNLFIGERGTFVVLIGLIILTLYYFKPLYRLKLKYILSLSFLYILSLPSDKNRF